jgi:hypothetical protein
MTILVDTIDRQSPAEVSIDHEFDADRGDQTV